MTNDFKLFFWYLVAAVSLGPSLLLPVTFLFVLYDSISDFGDAPTIFYQSDGFMVLISSLIVLLPIKLFWALRGRIRNNLISNIKYFLYLTFFMVLFSIPIVLLFTEMLLI
jgi:hypothetical protein